MTDYEQIMRDVANEIATNMQYENYNVEIKPISTDGANYSSLLFVATISVNEKENVELFAKIANIGKALLEELPDGNIFNTEFVFYTDLLTTYENLQEKNRLEYENRIKTAKFYAIKKPISNEILVLENLLAKGYTTFDRFKCVDLKYASRSIEELAKLHALSIALSEKYPDNFKKIVSKMVPLIDSKLTITMTERMLESALTVVEKSNSRRLELFFRENILKNFSKYYSPLRYPVILHGDYRPSNLMHKDSDGRLEVIAVDYQTMQVGCAVTDLLYFIFSSTDENFRRQYFKELVEHYYSNIRVALQRLNVDLDKIYTREDFDYELKEMMPFGIYVAVLPLQFVTVEVADAPKMDGSLSELRVKPSGLYAERLNGIVNDYIRWGII